MGSIATPPEQQGLLSVAEAARYLGGIHTSTIRRWCGERKLPYIKVGGRTMFRRTALDAYITLHEVPAKATSRRSA